MSDRLSSFPRLMRLTASSPNAGFVILVRSHDFTLKRWCPNAQRLEISIVLLQCGVRAERRSFRGWKLERASSIGSNSVDEVVMSEMVVLVLARNGMRPHE